MNNHNTHLLNKGVAKVRQNQRVFETLENRDHGKRKVKVNYNTWICTDKPTDQEAIDAYNKRHGIITNQ